MSRGDDVTTRRRRQREELCALCADGAVARAVDLAFEHFARFGRDEGIVDVLTLTIDRCDASVVVRRRLDELRASGGGVAEA